MQIDPSKYEVVKAELEKELSSRARKFSAKCSEIQSRIVQQDEDGEVFRPTEIRLKFSKEWNEESQRDIPPSPKAILLFFLMSWYIPEEELRILTQLYLHEKVQMLGPDYIIQLSLILESKATALELVLGGNCLGRNPNELFGVLLDKEVKVKMILVQSPKPKRTQRHRGYRDKGSRRLGIEFLAEERKDFSLTDLQNQIEERREETRDALAFLSGFLQL